MKLEWTVLLLRPDYTAATYGHDTYLGHITAPTATKALALAREDACSADENDPECREDYYCLFCTRGKHSDLCDGHGGVINDEADNPGEPEQKDRVVPDRNPNLYSPLYRFKCPKCGQYVRFEITVKTLLEVTDEGSENIGDHHDGWDQDSFCRCPECGWQGKVGEALGS